MAEHNWPSGLPCFLISGFSASGEDGVIRSQVGRASKLRPKFTGAPPQQVTAEVLCNKAQLQTLMDFWAVTLRRVLPFNHRDYTKPDETTVEYRFLARPSYVPAGSGMHWRVSLQLEQLTTFQGTFPLGDGGGSLLGDGSGNTITT